MLDKNQYRGIFPAFYACYNKEGNISPERVRQLTQFYIDKGVQGLYVGGSSGECIYQSIEERKIVLENVMAIAKGKITIIAHIACINTADSMILAMHAQEQQVNAIAAIPPIYFKLPEHSISDYWNDISSAAPDTDFILYNIPQLAGVELTNSLLSTMIKNPRVIGVKNTSMPTLDIQQFMLVGGENFIVFNGPDEQLIAGLTMGAIGGIGGTYGANPELFVKLMQLYESGNMKEALNLQTDINELIFKYCGGKGHMYAVIKEVLRRYHNMDIGSVRKPLSDCTKEDEALIESIIKTIERIKERYSIL